MSKIIRISALELARMQAEFADRDLAVRDKHAQLADFMILHAKGARMVRPEVVNFDEDEDQ